MFKIISLLFRCRDYYYRKKENFDLTLLYFLLPSKVDFAHILLSKMKYRMDYVVSPIVFFIWLDRLYFNKLWLGEIGWVLIGCVVHCLCAFHENDACIASSTHKKHIETKNCLRFVQWLRNKFNFGLNNNQQVPVVALIIYRIHF